MENLKLFMLMLGCKPPGRHVEQHDVFFGIAPTLRDLIPQIEAFWPEPAKIHIDAWREVNTVDGYAVKIASRSETIEQSKKLFFINLGGYQPNKFEEQHYIVLSVQNDFASASKNAKETLFFKHNHFAGANSHIDDKYGVDVDDIYNVEDILNAEQKAAYQIQLIPEAGLPEDKINLGYFKLSNL
ncbi:DUF1543 domain-containing protein [Mucilaginibacter sp. CAU 1740]|uniref:DUF1543 domain-containing protein n=1 Tax=Mucilaginibacter sp. CAU 1740 TaxID=3140365 RepID=UPI00325A7FE5